MGKIEKKKETTMIYWDYIGVTYSKRGIGVTWGC